MINQANQLLQQGKLQQAEHLYRQLLQINTDNIDALWGLGKVALAFDSYQHAYDIFRKCIALRPTVDVLLLSLAQACQKLTRFDEAEVALQKAYSLSNNKLATLLPLAVFYCQCGEYEKAKMFLDKIDVIFPFHVQAFCLKVRIKLISCFDHDAKKLLSNLSENGQNFSWQESVLLHYAFANLYQNSGDYEQAFKHFKEANELQFKEINFTVNDMKEYFQQIALTFNENYFKGLTDYVFDEEEKFNHLTPIFIVGQPRSGSTLLEQMLIGHSDISSGGELPFIAGDIAQGVFQITQQDFPQGVATLSKPQYEQQRKKLAEHYLAKLQSISPNANYIIDKMPANYQSIGLIKLLMPQAKIIHITRDVIDVSWSIYSNHFESLEPYFCSLADIGKYNHYYQKIMAHWQLTIPKFIHTISYDDLVTNSEQEITRVLKFCGLNYQENCLSFNEHTRHINTLSDIQLRKGVNKKSKSSWLPYQKYLSELFKLVS